MDNSLTSTTTPTTTSTARIPFLPLALESAIRAAEPLAQNLAHAAPELDRFSHDQLSTRRYMSQQTTVEAQTQSDLAQQMITSHLQSTGELFVALQAYLLTSGTCVEALAIAQLHPSDEDKLAKAMLCQVQTEEARDAVLAVVEALGLDATQLPLTDRLEPGALFTACEVQLEALQKHWTSLSAQAQAKALKLQSRSLYLTAANCLVNLAETALDEVLCFDDVPAGLEAVLVRLETAMTHPFSGAWPQSSAVAMDQATVVSA